MKTRIGLVMAVGLFGAMNAFAWGHHDNTAPLPTAADSWQVIRADQRVVVGTAAYAENFGSDGFFNACVAGDKLRSINPIKVCAQMVSHNGGGGQEGPGGWDECVREEYRAVELPRLQHYQVCAQESGGGGQEGPGPECVLWRDVSYTIPTSFSFSVSSFHNENHGQESGGSETIYTKLFDKGYDLPACN